MDGGLPGAAIVALVAALALALGNSAVFVPLLIIGPLVTAVLASPRATLGVALLAVACAIPLGLADHRFLSAEHIGEVAVVAAGGVLAVLAAKGRRSYEEALLNERAARRRSDFVARAGQLLDAPPEPEAMLREIVRMAVPDMAELCIVDLVHDGRLGETTAYATNPRTLEMLHASRVSYPLDPAGPHPVAVVARTGRPHLQHEIGAERLRAFAVDEQHLKLMAGAALRHVAGGAAHRPRAHDRRAELHALRRLAPLRRRRHRARRRGRAPRGAWRSTTRACSPSCAAPRASSRRSWPTSPPR